jgi:uncharacterized membrane protein YgcG
MKSWKVFVMVGLFATIPVAAFATWSFSDTKTFGPLRCEVCQVQAQIADVATQAFLREYVNANSYQAYGKTFYRQNPGDTIIVCNATVCTTYVMTDSRDWNGIERRPIDGAAGGGAHSGGGYQGGSSNGGGGYSGPTGGGGGQTGTVNVGGPKPLKPGPPTSDN